MAWINRHPNLVTWAVLSIGMVAIVGYSARDVDTLAGRQWFWLAFATVLVAGLCAWIISWEADEADEAADDDAADIADAGGAEIAGDPPADVGDIADGGPGDVPLDAADDPDRAGAA